jgi:glycosyltransferase involved in cell wall biosynthesis
MKGFPEVTYLAPADIQVARVDRQCIVGFCSALAELGVDVELVAMRIRTMDSEPRARHPLDLYRIRTRFPTRLVRVPVRQESGKLWTSLNRLVVHLPAILRTLRAPRGKPVILYTKTYSTGFVSILVSRLARCQPHVTFEAHVPPSGPFQRFVLRNADKTVANSRAMAAKLVGEVGLPPHRVLAQHQGVDLELIEQLRLSSEEARTRLRLPLDKRLVVYTGKIYVGYEEVELVLQAARLLEDRRDVEFVLVGGRHDHVERLQDRVRSEERPNVRFVGFVPPIAVQNYQFAADVLVLYYPSGMPLNSYRSPGKLFEYMAAERPIVAVDLPVLREVLGDEPAAVLVPPDQPRALANAIVQILDDPARARSLASKAHAQVTAFTWQQRARSILEFVLGSDVDGCADRRSALANADRRAVR